MIRFILLFMLLFYLVGCTVSTSKMIVFSSKSAMVTWKAKHPYITIITENSKSGLLVIEYK